MTIVIKNGRVIDPANGLDEPKDLLIQKGRIKALESPGNISFDTGEKPSIIDAKGMYILENLGSSIKKPLHLVADQRQLVALLPWQSCQTLTP